MADEKKIIILGAGISGLATAHWLAKDGFDVTILESALEPGGSMRTIVENNFLIDFGPNSGLETTPLIRQLVDEVGLSNEMIYASESSNKRYILRNDKLNALPTSPPAFIKTKLFSTKAKLRLFAEPFIGKSNDGYYQSLADFVRRRLGQEFLDYAIDPFVSGVFAGDPFKLSVKSAFPKLYRLEEVYGGLIKGMIKGAKERKKRAEQSKQNAKMFSFVNGMQSFTKAIAEKLNVEYGCNVKCVLHDGSNYRIEFEKNGRLSGLTAGTVISTVPVYTASKIFSEIDSELMNHSEKIYYPPVMVLYLGFKKESIGIPLDGFGYLIPSKEKKNYLGAIWSSTIFNNRCDDSNASFTLFVGGARAPHLFVKDEEQLVQAVIKEFNSTMKINAEPILIRKKLWAHAIPQYNIGYIEHENYFDKFENKNPGLFLSGNYRGGISVGDCVKNSELVYNRVKSFLSK